ncbi:DUF4469 domain-containing protein [Parabacteroides sp. FAFU027]|uniref:DUF4469 domain-containing protein n=1 Tax=Parabacteroides sp. FAFU027 TaxID=2922715 RepID=UPI001FAFB0D5|nr:DUF4469 domain-containing protein [Parabacteroides sp. FAFU027]
MATTDNNSVIVELYDLSITERKDDRFGRVVTTKSLTENDLINIAVARRTDLNPVTLKASMEILKEIAKEQIANGASVSFGLGYFSLLVNGVFIGDNAKWDDTKHSLSVRVSPTADLRSATNSATVDVRGMAETGTVINSLFDVTSKEVNSRLTPSSGVQLAGSKIKIAGDNPANGISLINQVTHEVIAIPSSALLLNDPSKIIFIVPQTLPQGDYKLSLTTQFSNSVQTLKEPRTYLFDYLLNV